MFVWKLKRNKKKKKFSSLPILFFPISLTLTSCWNTVMTSQKGLDHSMSLLLEHYILMLCFILKVMCWWRKREPGEGKRDGDSHTKFGRRRHLRRWRVTARPSEEQITDCQELHWDSNVPSLFSPHPSKPFTNSSSRRWHNCQQQLPLWLGADRLSHRLLSDTELLSS